MPPRRLPVDTLRNSVIIAIGGKIGNSRFRLDPAPSRSTGVTQNARSCHEVDETTGFDLLRSARRGTRLPQSASNQDNVYANGSGACRPAA
jgi:hypothetical protein